MAGPTLICVAVALQRYFEPPPVAMRQRELALALASSEESRIHIVTVEARLPLVAALQTLRQKLEDYASSFLAAGAKVQTEILQGNPTQQISAYVGRVDADLLVLGSHSKRSPLQVPLGNHAEGLLRSVSIPLVLIRPSLVEVSQTYQLMIPGYPWTFVYV